MVRYRYARNMGRVGVVMINISDIIGVAPWVVVSSGMAWIGQAWLYRDKRIAAKEEQHSKLEIHRDELTFELLTSARQEMSAARVEVEDLRDEVRKLRAMEQHFYHFQQAMDHLEALLFPEDAAAREIAERNARAFINRMRRLNEAKGTVANEAQRHTAAVHFAEKKIDKVAKELRDDDG